MKKALPIFWTISVLIILLTSCNRVDDDEVPIQFMDAGVITAQDFALCPCCGGHLITIDGIEDRRLNIFELPAESDIDLSTVSLPLRVKLNYESSDSTCTNIIFITAIEKE